MADFADKAVAPDRSAPVPGEAVLVPAGVRVLARETLARGETLEQSFAAQGFGFLGTVGPDAALLEWKNLEKTAASPTVSVARLAPSDRQSTEIRGLMAKGFPSDEPEIALVVYAAGAADRLVERTPWPPGASVTGVAQRGPAGRVGVVVQGADFRETVALLSRDPRVFRIERGGGARLLNTTARRIVQSGQTSPGGETIWTRGLHGQGQVIAILDTGADPMNCYLGEADASIPPVIRGSALETGDPSRRKIVAYNMLDPNDEPTSGSVAYDSQGHGTSVAGNALGSDVDEPLDPGSNRNGVAPAAKLVVQDGGFAYDNCADLSALGCPVIDLTDILEQAYFQGARIHSNSWGDRENFNPQNIYTAVCGDMDDIMWRRPDFLIIAAAGNSAVLGEGSVGSPSIAKNVISVAGTQNPDFNSIASFSSIGWAEDGRIKPDLAAPAQTSTAARDVFHDWGTGTLHCNTRYVQGTSMATPITAGAAALVRQYFEEGWYPTGSAKSEDAMTSPSAALIKAVMINGAVPMDTQPALPSNRQGWGRIDLETALYFVGDEGRLFVADKQTGFASSADAPYSRMLTVEDAGDEDLWVTLAYSDYAATPGANPALVNDLDLEVIDPGGGIYLGNQFDELTGESIEGGESDTINNVEAVRLSDAAPGTYTVRVRPTSILHANQPFALAVRGNLTEGSVPVEIDAWMVY